jgi:prolyl-tRNA synthetase
MMEIKGIPLRLEIGPKEVKEKFVTAVRRDRGQRQKVEMKDLALKIAMLLEQVQNNLYLKAEKFYEERIVPLDESRELESVIAGGKLRSSPGVGRVIAPIKSRRRPKRSSTKLADR